MNKYAQNLLALPVIMTRNTYLAILEVLAKAADKIDRLSHLDKKLLEH